MRKLWVAAALCLALSGCSGPGTSKDEFPFTPFPYGREDEFYEVFAKSLVNVPVWVVEYSLVVAFFAAYLWVQVGAPTRLR